MDTLKLSDRYTAFEDGGFIEQEIPTTITDNLNPRLVLRPYQKRAIARFVHYWQQDKGKTFPIQLLFNMATGSGKTLIMAAAMLYLYEKGYRNIVFFVDKKTIITKTIDNFLGKGSLKYLFASRVFVDGSEVTIAQVDNFTAGTAPDTLKIHFATIGGLHGRLNDPKENAVTFDDFAKEKTVFISDEAHHINALTKKKKTAEDMENITSWEYTVNRLVTAHPENVLLEFTATIDWQDPSIAAKYNDRVLVEYDLRSFREDGFSKDVFLLQSDAPLETRMLQAVLVSLYRQKVAEKNRIALKPVVLFKSKTIKESQENHRIFCGLITHLDSATVKSALNAPKNETEKTIISKAIQFFITNNDDAEALVNDIRSAFAPVRLVEVNSTDDAGNKQILLNTLESHTNEIRAIFAVDMLNEGWDVLNLFDIVRLYGARDSGKPTVQEAQLVGRGARYCPFVWGDEEQTYVRKFDKELDHELRAIEQLHFHSLENHRYIAELRKALIESGIHKEDGREVTLIVKESFKKTHLYQKGMIWKNTRVINTREQISSLSDLGVLKSYRLTLDGSGDLIETGAFDEEKAEWKSNTSTERITINKLPLHVVRKAIDRVPFFSSYENLSLYTPHIESIEEFIAHENYLGGITLELIGNRHGTRTLFVRLVDLLEGIKNTIKANASAFQGSREFIPVPVRERVTEKTLFIKTPTSGSAQEFGRSMSSESPTVLLDLRDKEWYIYSDDYGTDEEKYLVRFIAERIEKLSTLFSNIHLIRNQKIVELYDFKEGRRFEPDYLLFLGNGDKKMDYLQLFIEPKGAQLEDSDRWKEDFLKEIKQENSIVNLLENDRYNIFGLPFYQERNKIDFEKAFDEIIKR